MIETFQELDWFERAAVGRDPVELASLKPPEGIKYRLVRVAARETARVSRPQRLKVEVGIEWTQELLTSGSQTDRQRLGHSLLKTDRRRRQGRGLRGLWRGRD